ncbi:rhodanese-like domain-containing protein [Azospirillum agricola]|uniref:rhodanese-like domain-containing protein n=1 Tax=Azospirillum agricola TaxID=1720247 RepID=UPI000A0F2169|nr:rhodanese-like domain-containing protein [Azospirillum agricola]SMH58284.1 Rhodanese-related sulfurtransferase [Azospirillum lipoferum]
MAAGVRALPSSDQNDPNIPKELTVMSLCALFRRLLSSAPAGRSGTDERIRQVDPATAIGWLAEGKLVVVDVREPQEHRAGRIPGAILNPLSSFDPAAVPYDPDRRLLFHCQSGRRCGPAAERLMATDFQGTVHRLQGGLAAWAGAGGPVER